MQVFQTPTDSVWMSSSRNLHPAASPISSATQLMWVRANTVALDVCRSDASVRFPSSAERRLDWK